MTIKSLFDWNFGHPKPPPVAIERWHPSWEHKSHGHSHGWHSKGGGKGGSGAALSALALLAFLFLLNTMQQSLNDNANAMPATTTAASTFVLRESPDNQYVPISQKEKKPRNSQDYSDKY